jgi:hypothetical protein
MSVSIQKVEYFYSHVKDKPGEAYKFLTCLAEAWVNLLAFNVIPTGPEHTQLVIFPERSDMLRKVAEEAGCPLEGPHQAFLIQGDDKLGAIAEIHRRLADGHVNVYQSNGVTDGRGGYGYILWVRPEDIEQASELLGIEKAPE